MQQPNNKRTYVVEGGINFFEELLKPVTKTEDTEDKEDNNDKNTLCLITDNPLTEHYVELECNHRFNYLPLYAEVKYQKLNKHCLEVSRLTANEIKCPYCRKIQRSLLPYYESLDQVAPKIYGVNSITPPPPVAKTVIKKPAPATCKQILKSGVNKGAPCSGRVSKNGLCIRHCKMMEKVVEVNPILEAISASF